MLCRGYAYHVIREVNLQGATFEAKKGTPERLHCCGAKKPRSEGTVFAWVSVHVNR